MWQVFINGADSLSVPPSDVNPVNAIHVAGLDRDGAAGHQEEESTRGRESGGGIGGGRSGRRMVKEEIG